MGHAPSKPSPSQALAMREDAAPAIFRAARALQRSEYILVAIGDGLEVCPLECPSASMRRAGDHPELFYGHWGQLFNRIRETPAHGAYEILSQWCKDRFSPSSPNDAWKAHKSLAHDAALLDLAGSSSENEEHECISDEEEQAALAQLPFDSHAPQRAERYHLFTSACDGHAAKLFGSHAVRECHGSIQLWQCGAPSGPCRDSDAWEAPDGFTFNVVSSGPGGSPVAPAGQPQTRPPIFAVPMHNGIFPRADWARWANLLGVLTRALLSRRRVHGPRSLRGHRLS